MGHIRGMSHNLHFGKKTTKEAIREIDSTMRQTVFPNPQLAEKGFFVFGKWERSFWVRIVI